MSNALISYEIKSLTSYGQDIMVTWNLGTVDGYLIVITPFSSFSLPADQARLVLVRIIIMYDNLCCYIGL